MLQASTQGTTVEADLEPAALLALSDLCFLHFSGGVGHILVAMGIGETQKKVQVPKKIHEDKRG